MNFELFLWNLRLLREKSEKCEMSYNKVLFSYQISALGVVLDMFDL